MDYLSKNIIEIHNALVNKEVTPLDLVKEALDKIKNDNNNAFEYVYEKEAIEIAEELSKEEPDKNNPLWGIPFAVKDNFSTKDIPTCASSKLLEGYIPPFDSEVYLRLLNKKAASLGGGCNYAFIKRLYTLLYQASSFERKNRLEQS